LIVAIAAGPAKKALVDPFACVRTHAIWRARHQVPLTASLHAYRLAHKTYWGITREALSQHPEREAALHSLTMLSDFWIEFFDHVGAVLAEVHAVEEGLGVAQNTSAYGGLIEDLLRGREPAGAEARRLRTLCNIQPGASLAVAAARPFQTSTRKQIDHEVTLRSLVRLLQQILPSSAFGKLVHIQNGEVIAIVSSNTDTARVFMQILRRHGFGRRSANALAVGVGVSLNTTDIALLPDKLEEARLALEFASPTRPLMDFSKIDLPEFLIQRADRAAMRLVAPWTHHLTAAGDVEAAQLSRTIHAFAHCSLNVKQTAGELDVHTNTVYFRLNRIRKLTGIDPRTFSGISLIVTALRLVATHGATPNANSTLPARPPNAP
jgi:hypothetical protein